MNYHKQPCNTGKKLRKTLYQTHNPAAFSVGCDIDVIFEKREVAARADGHIRRNRRIWLKSGKKEIINADKGERP
ncbi:MAG TPA: hypothetical protein H9684_09940 [Firmicutes bacterium]|nr:hypothetical protein [Bacillota bacterium]